MIRLALISIFCLLHTSFLSAQGLKGIYTIGENAANYISFTEAIADLKNRGIDSTTRFKIQDGEYNEIIEIPYVTGVSEDDSIIFESINGPTNCIISKAGNGVFKESETYINKVPPYSIPAEFDFHVVRFKNSQWVTFRGITVENLNDTLGSAVHITNNLRDTATANNLLDNCIFKVPRNPDADMLTCIYFKTMYEDTFVPNVAKSNIDNNIIKNCTTIGGRVGISMAAILSTGNATNHVGNSILDNKILDAGNTGLQVSNVTSAEIKGNYIQMNTQGHSNYANGIRISTVSNYLIANNQVTGDFSNLNYAYGIYINDPTNVQLYHNSVYFNAPRTVSPPNNNIHYSAAFYFNDNLAWGNFDVKNNIFYSSGTAHALNLSVRQAVFGAFESDYNNYFSNGSDVIRWGGRDFQSVENYHDYTTSYDDESSFPKDANSFQIHPQFNSQRDLHLFNPVLNNQAVITSVVRVGDDMDHESRSTSTPDIGADEYTPKSFDVAILDVSLTDLPRITQGNKIRVNLSNFGTSSLVDSVIGISYSIDSLKWSSVQQIELTKLLNPFDTMNVYFDSLFLFENHGVNRVHVRLSFPNGIPDMLSLNNQFSKSICVGLDGTYTVGTSGDFLNISDALNALQICDITGPVVFNIEQGSYNEFVDLPYNNLSHPERSITLQSATGNPEDVLIIYSPPKTANRHAVVRFAGARYTYLKNLTIVNSSPGGKTSGVQFASDSRYCKIENCIIKNIQSQISIDSFSSGIIFCDSSDRSLGSQNAENNLIKNNSIIGFAYGIYMNGISPGNFLNKIDSNYLVNNSFYGLYFSRHGQTTISNNHIDMYSLTPHNSRGIYSEESGELKIQGNQILNASFMGVELQAHSGGGNSIISNNMIGGTFNSPDFTGGLNLSDVNNTLIAHNSVLMTQKNGTALYYNYGTNNTFRNNIYANLANGYAYVILDTASFSNSDYNNVFTTGDTLGYILRAAININDLRIYLSEEQNSISTNPLFLSNEDLHASSEIMNDKGTPIASVKTDIDGQSRNINNPDMGADEYSIGVDAGILSITSPKFIDSVKFDSNVLIKFTLKNYGTNPLNRIPYTVKWNGQNIYMDTLIETVNPGASKFVNTSKLIALNKKGLNTICIKTNVPLDINNANDSLCTSFIVKDSTKNEGGDSVINRTNPDIQQLLKTFPNPTKDKELTLTCTGLLALYQEVKVFSITGTMIPVKLRLSSLNSVKIHLPEDIKPGYFILRVTMKDGNIYHQNFLYSGN